MAVHLLYFVTMTLVDKRVADLRDALQVREDEPGQGFKAGVARQQKIILLL